MLSDSTSQTRPPFPTYLLPSFAFARPTSVHRRQSSTTSIRSSISSITSTVFSLASLSPTSSANTTPSSSPSEPSYFTRQSDSITFAESPREYACPVEDTDADIVKLKRTQPDTLKCSTCATDIALVDQIVSKGFTGRHGRAYLVSPPPSRKTFLQKMHKSPTEHQKEKNLINIRVGRAVNRQLVTGAHVVADISCNICGTVIGWKYVDAKEITQKYKIGKFILETKRVVNSKSWEGTAEGEYSERYDEFVREAEVEEDEIVFDSEDEDECEDLFTGTWDAEIVAKRRLKKLAAKKRAENGI